MKKIKLLALAAVMPLLALKAAAAVSLPTGPVSFKLIARAQLADSISQKTNKTTKTTNIVTTTKSTIETKSVLNKQILQLLANSFTNLPTTITNGQLVTDGQGRFLVVTKTSTNDVSSVLSVAVGTNVFAGSETIVKKTPPGTLISEIENATSMQVATLTYNDSSLTTRNSKHTSIRFQGLLVGRHIDATSKFTTSLALTGQGDGTVEDKFVVLTGTVSANIRGSVDLDDLP